MTGDAAVSGSLRDALEKLRENGWSFEEIVKEAIREAEWCCEVGCGSGACESCPCCRAGYCVSGRDGLATDDPEEVGRWLEIAAEHNPAIAALRPLLASHPVEPAPVVDRAALDKVLEEHEIVWRPEPENPEERYPLCWCGWLPDSCESYDEFLKDYRDHRTDAVLALIGGEPKPACGAVDRTGQRRCVFTPGHHEVENWTSHGDRGGWTWNDPPADGTES